MNEVADFVKLEPGLYVAASSIFSVRFLPDDAGFEIKLTDVLPDGRRIVQVDREMANEVLIQLRLSPIP